MRFIFVFKSFSLLLMTSFCSPVMAKIIVDQSDSEFYAHVQKELDHLRTGDRGVVGQVLVERLDNAPADTTITPVTRDDRTWHPNDRKGTRSHVVAQDTLVRGAARNVPTSAVVFVHPTRVTPTLSLFKLGTFIHELAQACDLNRGEYSSDFQVVEKRAAFFRNAWRDSFGWPPLDLSGRVPTKEYQEAKKAGLIDADHSDWFPILDINAVEGDIGGGSDTGNRYHDEEIDSPFDESP